MTTEQAGQQPRYEEQKEKQFKFKFVDENGTVVSVPMVGEVNVIELQQERRTDWLITKLPKELALKYTSGTVKTIYEETKGDVCVIVTKYRGDAIDPAQPRRSGECYTLIFTPYYAERNVNVEQVDEGITDEDIRKAMLALDESKGLYYRNKFLVAEEMRSKQRDYYEDKQYDFREAVTRTATTLQDDVDLGLDEVKRDITFFDTNKVMRWVMINKIWLTIVILIILIIAATATGGG